MSQYFNYGMLGVWTPVWIPVVGLGVALVVVWSIFWKGLALWHAARRGQLWWFLVLLVLNTAGILEIVYIFLVLKIKPSELIDRSKP